MSSGRLRRLIDLRCRDGETVVAWLEDDFHHFGVTLVHDGNTVREVRAATLRYPWSSCPGAAAPLRSLIGQALIHRASDVGRLLEMRLQCTHLFDLAGLALAQAALRREHRRYEIIVEDPEVNAWDEVRDRPASLGPSTAVLSQNQVEVMRWELQAQVITGPAPYAGQSLQRGFREWTEALPEQQAEYAGVLRRAVMVSFGRLMNMRRFPTTESVGMSAVCHSYQPDQRVLALNTSHLQRDYAQSADGMLSQVDQIP
jgi:hypothetical protein